MKTNSASKIPSTRMPSEAHTISTRSPEAIGPSTMTCNTIGMSRVIAAAPSAAIPPIASRPIAGRANGIRRASAFGVESRGEGEEFEVMVLGAFVTHRSWRGKVVARQPSRIRVNATRASGRALRGVRAAPRRDC